MMELAGLPKLARAVFEVVLAGRFVGAEGEATLRRLHATSALNARGVVVLATFAVLAPARPEVVSAILLAWPLGVERRPRRQSVLRRHHRRIFVLRW